MIRNSTIALAAVVLGVAALTGCASMEPPNAEMAASRTAVEQARLAGAPETAGADYNSARSKLDRAETAYRAEDYVLAGRLAREAEVDAQLAQSRASTNRSRQALAEVEAGSRALREEMHRVGNRP